MPSLYTPEEIDAIFQQYEETLLKGEVVTEELANAMKDAQKGVKGYTNEMNKNLSSLKNSAINFGSAMYEGKQGADQYSSAMKSGADVISTFASQFGILGMVIGTVIKAATAYVTAVNKQSDALYDSFQKMNQVGAVGAGGMSEIFTNMQKMGYGIEQLGDMTALLKSNAATLAHFGGTVADGTKSLAELSDQVVHSDLGKTFMNMGMTIDDINRGGASYLKLQTAMGRNTKEVGDQLTSGTVEYMTQLRMLSKITGDTLEAQQAKIDAAMGDEAVNQVMTELQQRIARAGPGKDTAAENQLKKIETLMASDMPDEMKKAMLGALGGDAAAANKVFMTMPTAFKMLTDSSVSTNQFMDQTVTDISQTLDKMGGSAKVHAFGETFGDMKALREYVAGGNWSDRAKSAEKNLVATDKATTAQTDMRVAQMNTRDSMQSLVNAGIVPVTESMAALAKVTNGLAGIGKDKQIGGGTGLFGGRGPGENDGAVEGLGGKSKEISSSVSAKTQQDKDIFSSQAFKDWQKEKGAGMFDRGMYSEKFGVAAYQKEKGIQPAAPSTPASTAAPDVEPQKPTVNVNEKKETKTEVKVTEPAKPKETPPEQRKPEVEKPKDMVQAVTQNAQKTAEEMRSTLEKAVPTDKMMDSANQMMRNAEASMRTLEGNKPTAETKPEPTQPSQKPTVDTNKKQGYADGGVASGPTSGYQTVLHGTEAVVPLPDGKNIPVEMPDTSGAISEQTQLLSKQIEYIEELISVVRNQVSVSNKILQQAK